MKIQTITQIHTSYDRLGVYERVSLERWRALNPDIKYQFITDADIDDFIAQEWPNKQATYQSMMPICRAGIQRAAAVLRWGGLYTDCGSYPVRPIEDFRPSGTWNSDIAMFKLRDREGSPPLITDCMFAAEKGHPVLRALIDEIFNRTESDAYKAACVESHYFNYKRWVFDTASVHVYSDIANSHGVTGIDGLVDADGADLRERLDRVNIFRFSTESWVRSGDSRWDRDKGDRMKDEMNTLVGIKAIAGI